MCSIEGRDFAAALALRARRCLLHNSTMADLPSSSDTVDGETKITAAETEALFPNLPNDVGVQCLARVPRPHHPSLSLVCKSWLSLVRSEVFYSIRRSLLSTDFSLYVNIRFPSNSPSPSFKWFLVHPQNKNYLKSQALSIPLTPCSQPIGASIVSLGSKIYVIGGSVDEIPTSGMWILDSVSNQWVPGPQMRVAREFAAAGVVDGKIYILGGCPINTRARTLNWAEVFDPNTQLWSPVPSSDGVREGLMHASAVVGEKIYAMADRGGVVYDVSAEEWGSVPKRLDMGWRGRAAVVSGLLFCYDYLGKIKGFDVDENVWKELKGVNKGLPKFMSGATLTDVDGRLFIVWVEKGSLKKEMEVWCAEIEVDRDREGQLLGSIAWSGVILVVPDGSMIINCLAVGF